MTMCSAGLEALVVKEECFHPGDATIIPLKWKLRPAAPLLWSFCASESMVREGSYCGDWFWLPRVNCTTTPQWKWERCLEYRWSLSNTSNHLMIKGQWKNCNNPIQAGLLMAQDPSRIKVKNHNQLIVLLKVKGIWNGLWRKVVIDTTTSTWPVTETVNTSSLFSAILNFCAPHNSYVATIIPNVLDFGGFFF